MNNTKQCIKKKAYMKKHIHNNPKKLYIMEIKYKQECCQEN